MQKSNHSTFSAEETESLGAQLAGRLKNQNILLFGDLGLGKTTFLRGLAKGLGIKAKIKSPTFVCEKIYPLPARHHSCTGRNIDTVKKVGNLRQIQNNKEKEVFIHLDLYRTEKLGEDLIGRLIELFSGEYATIAVEWSEHLPKKLLPKKRVEIRFAELKHDKRKITLQAFS